MAILGRQPGLPTCGSKLPYPKARQPRATAGDRNFQHCYKDMVHIDLHARQMAFGLCADRICRQRKCRTSTESLSESVTDVIFRQQPGLYKIWYAIIPETFDSSFCQQSLCIVFTERWPSGPKFFEPWWKIIFSQFFLWQPAHLDREAWEGTHDFTLRKKQLKNNAHDTHG